jgi:hypothetical protein
MMVEILVTELGTLKMELIYSPKTLFSLLYCNQNIITGIIFILCSFSQDAPNLHVKTYAHSYALADLLLTLINLKAHASEWPEVFWDRDP